MFTRRPVQLWLLKRPARLEPSLRYSNVVRPSLFHREHLRNYSQSVRGDSNAWPYYLRRMLIAAGVFGVALYTL
jgi:hypothetical protein